MSEVSQGPGWWQASDGRWYPPEQHPAAAPPTGAATGTYASRPATQEGGYPTSQEGGYPSGTGGPTPGPLADWGTRALATLIDAAATFALVIAGFILAFILGLISSALAILVGLLVYLASIAAGFYFTYMTGAVGQSPGKKVMGIKVVNEQTGQPIGGGLGIVRGLAHILDGFFFIGYLFPLWDPKRQTFADKIMTTVVLSGIPKQPVSPDLLKV